MTPQQYNFTLTPEETQLVVDAVSLLQIRTGFSLYEKLRNEIIKQEAAADQKEVTDGK